jgi:hypothetical protein
MLGTSAEIVDKLNHAANAGLADPKMKARFADTGTAVLMGSSLCYDNSVLHNR